MVSQLNGISFLSKDQLTRVRNSINFNNADDYTTTSSSTSLMMFGLGYCGGFFYSATHGHPQLMLQFNGHEQIHLVFYKYYISGHGGLGGFKKSKRGYGPVGTNGTL